MPPLRSRPRRPCRRAAAALVLAALAAPAARAQEPPATLQVELVRQAAFDHWWPKYRRLMETLMRNEEVDSGRLRVPPPSPEDLLREIHVGAPLRNRYIPGYTFYGVHTQGAVFEGLFLMDPASAVRVLVNHDDPEDRKPVLEDAYVDHMNRILERSGVTIDDPEEAVSLTRFFLSTFFNFTVHPAETSVDSTVQNELQRVRVISSTREIPQGRRALRFGDKRSWLVFQPVPERVAAFVQPPVVEQRGPQAFLVKLHTWHPVRGEVRAWEILLEDDRFAFFRDRAVARWVPYRFEGLE